MAYSATIGQTIIPTSKVLEHAFRRCLISPAMQTPETVETAKECLFMLLVHYANRGLNLWCIERTLIGYSVGKQDYPLPVGTADVLNVLHCTPVLVVGTLASSTFTFDDTGTIRRVGVKFSVNPLSDFTISTSPDGAVYTARKTVKYLDLVPVGSVNWIELDPSVNCSSVRVSAGTVELIYVASSASEIPISQLNRDQYSSLPNKGFESNTVSSFMFNKTLSPNLSLWPIPNDESRHLALWVHRQVQDVGSLTQQLAVPDRWLEATVIQLSFRMSLEIPGVDPQRIELLTKLSEKFQIEAGNEETDSGPIYLQPRISPYTR